MPLTFIVNHIHSFAQHTDDRLEKLLMSLLDPISAKIDASIPTPAPTPEPGS